MTSDQLKEAMFRARSILEEEGATAPSNITTAGPSHQLWPPATAPHPTHPHPRSEAPANMMAPAPVNIPQETATPILHIQPASNSLTHPQADLEFLRKDFPAISHWPDEMLRAHPIGELVRAHAELETKLGRGGRPSLETQLDNNYQKLRSIPTTVPAGVDNLLD